MKEKYMSTDAEMRKAENRQIVQDLGTLNMDRFWVGKGTKFRKVGSLLHAC